MAAETSGANSYVQLLRDNEEHVMAFLDMRNEALNNQALSEILNNYYVNSFRTGEFYAALEQHVSNYQSLIRAHEEEGSSFECHPFATNFTSVYTRELLMRERLQRFQNTFVEKLRRVGALKKVSFVFFTAAAAISAAAAAAAAAGAAHKASVVVAAAAASAASVVFGSLGTWMHSLLKKNESAVHRHKVIIGDMIMGSKISTKDVIDIGVLALRLQEDSKSISEFVEVDVRERLEALNDKFQELGGKADAYSRHGSWIRGFVLQRVENTCITIRSE